MKSIQHESEGDYFNNDANSRNPHLKNKTQPVTLEGEKEPQDIRQLRKNDTKEKKIYETSSVSFIQNEFEGDSFNNYVNSKNPHQKSPIQPVTLERETVISEEEKKKRENKLMELTFTFDQIKRIKDFYQHKLNFKRNMMENEEEKKCENSDQNDVDSVNNIEINEDLRKKYDRIESPTRNEFCYIPEKKDNEEEAKSENNGQNDDDAFVNNEINKNEINEDFKKTDEKRKFARKSVFPFNPRVENDEDIGSLEHRMPPAITSSSNPSRIIPPR